MRFTIDTFTDLFNLVTDRVYMEFLGLKHFYVLRIINLIFRQKMN